MHTSHEIDYNIKGESIQTVEITLDPLETVIAEAGAMLYMENGINFETKMGDGANPGQGLFDKILSAGSRLLTGESLFMTHFTNRGIDFDVQMSGGLRSMVFGGEGIFLATLQGTGTVWLQSMPIRKLVQALAPYGRNSSKEGGSLLGGLFEDR